MPKSDIDKLLHTLQEAPLDEQSHKFIRSLIKEAYNQGYSDGFDDLENEISETLCVNDGKDVEPVVNHVKRLMQKLNIKSVNELNVRIDVISMRTKPDAIF